MSNEPNEADLIRSLNDSVFPNCGDEISICPVCFHDYPEHEDDCKFIVALRKLAAHRADESELVKALKQIDELASGYLVATEHGETGVSRMFAIREWCHAALAAYAAAKG